MKTQTIAEQWEEKIDRPWRSEPDSNRRKWTEIDRKAVRQMKAAAADVLSKASQRYTDIYVFADGSGLWEKRTDDWFTADEEEVAEAQAELYGDEGEGEDEDELGAAGN